MTTAELEQLLNRLLASKETCESESESALGATLQSIIDSMKGIDECSNEIRDLHQGLRKMERQLQSRADEPTDVRAQLKDDIMPNGTGGEATAEAKTKERAQSELYVGEARITLEAAADIVQIKRLEEHLRRIRDLHIVLIGGAENEDTQIIVSADKPLPLLDLLEEIPLVQKVVVKRRQIHVTLKPELQ